MELPVPPLLLMQIDNPLKRKKGDLDNQNLYAFSVCPNRGYEKG